MTAAESTGSEHSEDAAPTPLIDLAQMLDLAERVFLKTFVDGDSPAECAQGAIYAAVQFGLTWERNFPEPRKKRQRKPKAGAL